MCVSLLSNKLLEIQQLAHDLLQRKPITVHQAMSILHKTTFCAHGQAQLCQLCHVIQSIMLNVYPSRAQLFLSFHLSLPAQCGHKWLSQLQPGMISLQFPLTYVVITTHVVPNY